MISLQRIPWRLRFIAGALVFLSLNSCSGPPPETAEYKAWYRPVPLGFCPRYIIGDRHAWVVGKIAPGTERQAIERRTFVFRGYFVVDAEGNEKIRSSCDDRPYPIFHLVDLIDERTMELGEAEPKILRGPGRAELVVPSAPPPPVAVPAVTNTEPAAEKPTKRRYRGKRKRNKRRGVKRRRQRSP